MASPPQKSTARMRRRHVIGISLIAAIAVVLAGVIAARVIALGPDATTVVTAQRQAAERPSRTIASVQVPPPSDQAPPAPERPAPPQPVVPQRAEPQGQPAPPPHDAPQPPGPPAPAPAPAAQDTLSATPRGWHAHVAARHRGGQYQHHPHGFPVHPRHLHRSHP